VAQARLLPARPNPFAGSVTIPLELQSTAAVRLDVYDAAGRLVRTLREGNLAVGSQDVVWDGKDSGSRQVRAGVYYARLSAGETVAVQPMVLVK
jgi:flagellar hook assembly protein FlgD